MCSNLTIFYQIVILTCVIYRYTNGVEIGFTDINKCWENFTTDQTDYNRKFPIEKIQDESGIFLSFFVKGERDAHIIFSPDSEPKKWGERAYEIVLGVNGNSRSEIRQGRISNTAESNTENNIISDKEWRQFWIRISSDGEIQVGKGNNKTAFMKWEDPKPMQINHYGFSSYVVDGTSNIIEWCLLFPQKIENKPNTTDLISTSPQPPIQKTFEEKTEEFFNVISRVKKESEILIQVYSFIHDATQNLTKTSDDLTIAVFVPNNTTEINHTEINWPYRESNSTDEIDIKLPREIVNFMKSNSLVFKMAILKHTSHSSFDTIAKDGRLFKQGPFIIVKTNATDEISIGTPALEFKTDRNQLDPPKGKWNCRFWNNQTHDWEKRGIKTVKDDKYITCTSDHLSAFSMVMDPYYGTEDDDEILTVISVLGSLLTIPCLIFTIFFYHHKKTRRDRIPSKILMNCCLSLLLLHISFLMYICSLKIFPCSLLNLLVHYGVSSALLWTAVDGINMWRNLFVDVFNKSTAIFYRWSKIISWGFPFTTSVVGVLITDYSKKDECGIYFEHNMLLYLLPCALIIICNVIFFAIMFINVVCKNKVTSLTGKKKKYVMSLVQVFGLFWCISFPLLWLAKTRLLGHIVFALLVANQGVVIFIVRCMIKKETRFELLEYIRRKKIFRRASTTTDGTCTFTRNTQTEVTRISARSSDG